ncbi:HflK protein [Bartonella henselae]|uniref:Protein HflK n=1 Tax=Bartonella henselae (strain ATCC 49882 / DSM 28221 / CCUG 30454 / Houston 1) TaxID=283166 RepID=A0A0H3M3P7_BARHE|nr:FtsH protease activity modulator HflK [Bartonella henselae]ATP12590.1 HflK protein [Bartonella henselae]ETS08205.1 HflK protein [Bartonella henselae JK 50]ETS08753.1 HflK protein [Bartonella henselae JK 51]MDM9990356.1 FtsH protease activity modulator HflK [Bartonella henselae]OLL38539.1 phage tail protein [Bartonella henselae]
MPWTNQNGGGPWSGDKNKLSGDKKTPSKNLFGSGGNNGGDNSPNIDDILRKGQDQFKQFGKNGLFVLLFLFAVLFWLYQSLYIVQQNEQAVELRFGVPKTETIGDGLHFHFWPIETYMKVPLTEKTIAIGGQPGQRQQSEGLMLSSDQNIVNVNFSIYYRISHPGQFLFNVNDQEGTVRQVAESAMREVIGSRPVDDVLRDKKEEVASDVRKIIQLTVDKYQLGVEISRVSISEAAPPTKVAAAFNSVQQAEQERGRMIEEGNRVRFNKIGLANGEASRTREIAKGEKARMVEEATGRAERFQAIARESAISPEAVRYRLYMETMGRIFSSPNKLILDQTNSPAVPYLPLNELLRSNSSEKVKTRSAHSASLLDNHISGGR